MAVLITGLQGSGKSYKAVKLILDTHSDYWKVYTDIDGFKEFDNCYFHQFTKFKEILKECYISNVTNDESFQKSIDILSNFGVVSKNADKDNRTLIVVDEAQNHFGSTVKLEDYLLWFITQHRHLYIELVLITQKYTLLRTNYHLFNEIYDAVPPIKQINKNVFGYRHYATLPPNKDSYIGKITEPKRKEVFEKYVSGDVVKSPNVMKRFIIYMFLAVSILVLSAYYFIGQYGGTTTEKVLSDVTNPPCTHDSIKTPQNGNTKKVKSDNSDKKLYKIVIWNDDSGFYINGFNDTFSLIPISILSYLKIKFDFEVINTETDKYQTKLYIVSDDAFLYFLDLKKVQNRELPTNQDSLRNVVSEVH